MQNMLCCCCSLHRQRPPRLWTAGILAEQWIQPKPIPASTEKRKKHLQICKLITTNKINPLMYSYPDDDAWFEDLSKTIFQCNDNLMKTRRFL